MLESTIDTQQPAQPLPEIAAGPLPDAFSAGLVNIFKEAQPAIVQVQVAGRGGGTGVILSEDGYIITNYHVVAREHARVQALLVDGRVLEATVERGNPRLDLALLKVDGEQFKPLRAGDSDALRVGELVFAVGHPWGERWVVTAGIVSTRSSVKVDEDVAVQYIKSDVLLRPGNSGGPLLNADGEVVGINAMIFGGDLSVAIPSNTVRAWLADSLPRPKPGRGALGIHIQAIELPEALARSLRPQRETGVLVVGIGEERQAKHQDLLVGDILLDVGSTALTEPAQLRQALARAEVGDTIALHILRGGKPLNIDAAVLR